MPKIHGPLAAACAALLLTACGGDRQAADATGVRAPARPECIAPAAPGGSFDLTCKLAQSALVEGKHLSRPMRVTYMPGGVGAVAYNTVVAQRPADGIAIVAFSSGSLLNLAQGKFGRYDEKAVRWLAAIGTSYGAITVRADSPYRNLDDLVKALREAPEKIVIGAGGSVGGQDWMQTAMLARAAGIQPDRMRYVAMEGGGEIATALLGGHIQVASTDISDSMPMVDAGKTRVLAVLAEERLPGAGVAELRTAREQGYDVVWKVMRGYYMGPKVGDAEFAFWQQAFSQLLQSEAFARLRAERELFPLALTGPELEAQVQADVRRYRELAVEFGLVQP